jgi:multiple antibiotic resistance protein
MIHSIVQDLVTLLVVINPIGKVPLFIALAGHLPRKEQIRIAARAVIVAAIVLMFFLTVGQPLLNYLGINIVSVQIAGGVILMIIGLRMVLEEVRDPPIAASSTPEDIAVFPLAMPFIAGPGAIMTVMVLTDENLFSLRDQVETGLATLIVLAATFACLLGASAVNRLIGRTGANVVGRIMGLVLASLAVKAIVNGLHESFMR